MTISPETTYAEAQRRAEEKLERRYLQPHEVEHLDKYRKLAWDDQLALDAVLDNWVKLRRGRHG